jgi:imidazolonepropionase-like amidohydrolase
MGKSRKSERGQRGTPSELGVHREKATMRDSLLVTGLMVIAGCTADSAFAATKAIKAARMIDPAGRVIQNVVVIVDNDRITSVGTSPPPAGSDVIDVGQLTLIPGLIDVHTHITYYWDRTPGTKPLGQPRRPAGVTVVLAAENARRTLETGVTTVRDLGASNETDYAMRDLINIGKMVGPRMFVAGPGLSAQRNAAPNPDLYRQNAEARIAAGSDWVKIFGSRGSYQSVDTTQTVTFEEMKAAVDAAHAKGHRVAIHSYGASGVKDAVRAGADSIEHGIELDDETIAEMVKRGTVWVPTIDHNRYYVDAKDEFQFEPDSIPPLKAYIEKNFDATRRAVKAGVTLAMGSDAVYTMFGQNTRELDWFVKAGMTPWQALQTATTNAAKLLGKETQLGAIAPGYYADIVAVDGDPLTDINAVVNRVRWVMKAGTVVVDQQSDVQTAVERFLTHLGDGDFDKVGADLAPKSIVVITRGGTNTYQTGEEWLAGLRRNTNFTRFREPITNLHITIDSDALAYLRADFEIVRDGKAQSHGVDQFTLTREGGVWKVAVVAFTSIPNR